ncbi:MAG: hypothetical protein H7Y27_16470 [Gemmatimonadaceae bacterium]|nr:hypothetical protein [Chitinophagaceae bacterium]
MKSKLYLLLILVLAGFSCKKAIEKQKTNIIIEAMTNGRWYVELYKDNGTDVTSNFSGYEFQFYENSTVDGIAGAVTKKGTWNADINNYTIVASFPQTFGQPLTMLNYTWKITDSYLDYVEANTVTGSGTNILHLRKK